jgi:hypothetical protein
MSPKTIVCSVCGIVATRVHIEGKPWLEVDPIAFEASCTEQSIVPEPFRCPNMLSAARDAGLVGRDGWWIGWPRPEVSTVEDRQ